MGTMPRGIIWKGRQWAVTEYGLETLGEPYNYEIEKGRLGERADRGLNGEDVPSWLVHMMEKDWLDVDDFFTAYLVAVGVYAGQYRGPVTTQDIIAGLQAGLSEREDMYAARPGQIPRPGPPEAVTFASLDELDKYLPEPVWTGSDVLGDAVTGEPLPGQEDDEDEERAE